MIRMKEKTNWRVLATVKKKWHDGAKEGALDAANALVTDIRENWGKDGAAEIDSGNLDSAVMVNPRGRDDSGRFASGDNVTTYIVTANAQDGSSYHGRGNYSPSLEEGRSAPGNGAPAYPFMAPAVERVSELLPVIIKRRVT